MENRDFFNYLKIIRNNFIFLIVGYYESSFVIYVIEIYCNDQIVFIIHNCFLNFFFILITFISNFTDGCFYFIRYIFLLNFPGSYVIRYTWNPVV